VIDLRSLAAAEPFTTKDGSTIRELHHTELQSLAEATLPAGATTQRHYHARTEEIYFLLEGEGDLEVDGDRRRVVPGDAALIPAGAWHEITAATNLRFLCCCAPPYSHEDTFFT
jgi:mannose-6-phosphate isomerase-like protein (cupin superfamily)